jgi:large subunit ribosomal protein L22
MVAPAVKALPAKNAARPTTKAQVRFVRMSASKARQVLDLIRGKSVAQADEVLALSERDAGRVIQKCLRSAVANAEHNDGLDPDELFVATCFADEGPTLRRFRPRARGRATRIRKRTCHITVVVGRYDADELAAIRDRERAKGGGAGKAKGRAAAASRRARVAKSRGEEVTEATDEVEESPTDEVEETEVADGEPQAEEPAAEVDHDTEEATPPAEDESTEDEASELDAESLVAANSKDELLELAEQAGVEVAKSWTKPQIAEAIIAAREAATDDTAARGDD